MMKGGTEMKKMGFLVLVFFMGFLVTSFRVTQGIDEAGRAVVKAYKAGAKEKAPYLYNKSRGYREISSILASEADDVGSKVFAIRTMNAASKAITASFVEEEELTPIDDLPKVEKKEGMTFEVINLKEIKTKLDFIRGNKGLKCAPAELGRAEAFYDALVYEFRKEEPNTALLLRFYNEVNTESKVAESKLRVAMSNELECYTGKKITARKPSEEEEVRKEEVVEADQVEEKPEEQEVRVDIGEEEAEKEPQLIEEPLKITARIHFDFDRYNIRREYIPILNEVVKTLKENEYVKVRIEGFTDIIGSKEYNVKLAQKRAKTVKNYLVKHGIPEDKIEIVGFGKERFIASNENSIGRLTNRRVEFIVIKLKEE